MYTYEVSYFIAYKFTIQSLYLTMSTDDGLRICSPWFDAHHCCCFLEQGTLLPLLQSAAWTVTPISHVL